MDPMQQYLEEFATQIARPEEEPANQDLSRWHSCFGYSPSEALVVIERLRGDVNGRMLSDDQWNLIRAGREAEGYDRETYEHQLQLWSTESHSHHPGASVELTDTSSYVFTLGGPFTDIESLRRAVGVSAEARSGRGEEGDTEFACVDGVAKRVIEDWLGTQSPSINSWPTFIRLSQAPKSLSENSSYPTLGIDSTLPQHRMQRINQSFAPAQKEIPNCISLPHPPILMPASIKGGTLRTWGRKYKALVDGPATAHVDGYAYCVLWTEREEYPRFRETEAYEVVRCRITLHSEEGVQEEVLGLTFRFARHDELDVDQPRS